MAEMMMQQEDVFPDDGPFTAWATSSGRIAEVRNGERVVQRLSGQTAWQDAVREAGERNLRMPLKRKPKQE